MTAVAAETVTVEPAVEAVGTESVAVAPEPDLVVEELLVEDVSIDGMCGVY